MSLVLVHSKDKLDDNINRNLIKNDVLHNIS